MCVCVCVCGYKHVSAQAFYEHAIALLTPEILTLQPDRAATGKRVLVVVGGILILGGFCHQTWATRVATVAGMCSWVGRSPRRPTI